MFGSYCVIIDSIEVLVEFYYFDDEFKLEVNEFIWVYFVEIYNGGDYLV